ncbi:MAG: adenine nucleotide alpha hydrolase [Flavobacteriales bacterium]|nr:adenine nucleotide alpha hydrolase [Flavobacteriales bacterium]
MKKTYFNWSTGKDSAMALKMLLDDDEHSVEHLIISVNQHYDRVSMHGLRRELMEKQIAALNIPFTTIELPQEPSMEEYSQKMAEVVNMLRNQGFTHSGFGDIFLEDLRQYREEQLAQYDIKAVFPLWGKDTKELVNDFIQSGFKATTVCVKAEFMGEEFVGRDLDEVFVKQLPAQVDPCGENGEFHTFCYDGPIFSNPIPFKRGENTYREYESPQKDAESIKIGFWYCDLLPD